MKWILRKLTLDTWIMFMISVTKTGRDPLPPPNVKNVTLFLRFPFLEMLYKFICGFLYRCLSLQLCFVCSHHWGSGKTSGVTEIKVKIILHSKYCDIVNHSVRMNRDKDVLLSCRAIEDCYKRRLDGINNRSLECLWSLWVASRGQLGGLKRQYHSLGLDTRILKINNIRW